MEFNIVKLTFNSPVHLGEKGIGIETSAERVCSDTLFSGMIHAWATLYGKPETDTLINQFLNGEAPFLISSTFVFQNKTFYLPKPLIDPTGKFDSATWKKLKQRKYLSVQLFKKWWYEIPITEDDLNENYTSAFTSYLTPRVAIDRSNATSQIYYCGQIQFQKDAGLYFIIELRNSGIEQKVKQAISMLGSLGLGGERTYGFGQFSVSWEPLPAELKELFHKKNTKQEQSCLLSLYFPTENERTNISDRAIAYYLTDRRGWILSPFTKAQWKRKSVTMFAEGSVFKESCIGQLVEVTPSGWKTVADHNIYRYGYALSIPR